MEAVHLSSLFGELHLKEDHVNHHDSQEPSDSSSVFTPSSSSNSNLNPLMLGIDIPKKHENGGSSRQNMSSSALCYCPCDDSSFSSMSLSEGLGFESCDDDWQGREDRMMRFTRKVQSENESASKRMRSSSFPPPISCQPWVCYKSYRENGRFILKEIRIPNQEVLHSCCENGRFRLQFVPSEKDKDIGGDTNGEGEEEGEEQQQN